MRYNRDVPSFLRGRPRYKGMIVPYTVYVDKEGRPDFKVVDYERLEECIKHRLCGVCGHSMGKRVAFIGGNLALEQRIFTDPPMHEACALYSADICPFVSGDIDRLAANFRTPEDRQLLVNPNVLTERPAIMGVLYTKHYEHLRDGQTIYFRALEPVHIEYIPANAAAKPRAERDVE